MVFPLEKPPADQRDEDMAVIPKLCGDTFARQSHTCSLLLSFWLKHM